MEFHIVHDLDVTVCDSNSVMSDSATTWTVAHQAPLSMGFTRQESWSVLPFPSPRHLPYPGIKPRSPALQADALLAKLLLATTKSSSKIVTSIYTFKKSFWGFQLLHILVKSFARFINFFIFSNLVNIKYYLLVLIWLYLFMHKVLMNKWLLPIHISFSAKFLFKLFLTFILYFYFFLISF